MLSVDDGLYQVMVFPPRVALPATPWYEGALAVGERRQRVVVSSVQRAVRARVVCGNGESAGALVQLWRIGTECARTLRTDAEGRFECTGLTPGRYEGMIQTETEMEWIRPFEVEALRDHDLGTVTLAPFGSLALIAKGADGKRLRGMTATWWHEIPNLHAGLPKPSARVDDVVAVQRCAPGKWFVRLQAPGHCARICEVNVMAGQRTRSITELVPGVAIRLRIAIGHRGNTALLAAVRTAIHDAQGALVESLEGSTGNDELVHEVVLVPGKYRALVGAQYGSRAEVEFEVRGEGAVEVQVGLR